MSNLEFKMQMMLQRNQELMQMNQMILQSKNIMFITLVETLCVFLLIKGGSISNAVDVFNTN